MQRREHLGIVGAISMCVTLLIVLIAFFFGMRVQMDRVLTLCDQGGKFYRLDEAGDTPYRCTRVIDLPPSTTQGSTQ